MILYGYWRSSAAYRVRIALNLKGLQAEHRFVHLRKGEQRAPGYLETNPQGLVPTLVIDGRRFTQSLAIIEYLDETHPEPPLLPPNAEDRAFVRALAQTIACDIHPIDNTRVIAYLEKPLGIDQARRDDWYRHWIRLGFEAIEASLSARKASTFCFGDTPTLADICLVPQVANAGRVKLDLSPYPRIRAIEAACQELAAFQKARPDQQPDKE